MRYHPLRVLREDRVAVIERPQRLTPPSAPGALLKRLHGLARLRLREAIDHDPTYLALVRQCPCLKCGMEPAGEAAHVRLQSAAHNKRGGIGKKPADKWALSLCATCHRTDRDALHQIGEELFWHILGINPLLVCERLHKQRGDMIAMRAVILSAISQRGSK